MEEQDSHKTQRLHRKQLQSNSKPQKEPSKSCKMNSLKTVRLGTLWRNSKPNLLVMSAKGHSLAGSRLNQQIGLTHLCSSCQRWLKFTVCCNPVKLEVVEVALLARHELVPPPTGFPDFGDGSDLTVFRFEILYMKPGKFGA